MNKLIVIINGRGGVGKDTLIDAVKKDYCVTNYSSIDKVKEIAALGGWDFKDKSDKGRKLLADLKQAFLTYNDMPFKDTVDHINAFLENDTYSRRCNIMFVHIREPKEISRLIDTLVVSGALVRNQAKVTTLLIESSRAKDSYGNAADDGVYAYHYMFKYVNNMQEERATENFRQYFNSVVMRTCEESFYLVV